jgi:hypothetical protein
MGKGVREEGEKLRENPREQPQLKPKPRPILFHCEYCGRDGYKEEFCFKRKQEDRIAKDWANKDRYHPSHGVPEPCMSLPGQRPLCIQFRLGEIVRRSLSGGGAAGRRPPVRPVRAAAQTGAKQRAGKFGFCTCDDSRFSSFGHGTSIWHGEPGGVEFARRSPPRAQYEIGRSHSFDSQRGYIPWSSFHGARTPPAR